MLHSEVALLGPKHGRIGTVTPDRGPVLATLAAVTLGHPTDAGESWLNNTIPIFSTSFAADFKNLNQAYKHCSITPPSNNVPV